MAAKNANALTADRARELLDYDPATGILRWRVGRQGSRSGAESGSIHSTGYRRIKIDYCEYLAHRIAFLIVTGRWPKDEIDHINGIRDDNRWSNLRAVTHQNNQRNQRLHCNNTSGHTGVRWDESNNKWLARIGGNHLGRFDDLTDAVAARKAAERKYGFHENHGRAM